MSKSIPTFDGKTISVDLGPDVATEHWLALPALIDCHVHFRTPGQEHKENWETGARAAITGGVTTVLDMPNNLTPTTNEDNLHVKKELVKEQLAQVGIPLKHYFYAGATGENEEELEMMASEIVGVKMFMGPSTGNLLVSERVKQEAVFKLCADMGLVLAMHAEDEAEIEKAKASFPNPEVSDHSRIRVRSAAQKAVSEALEMAAKLGTKLYLCHVSTKEELELIRQAKKSGVKVFAETTPHHLWLNESAYTSLGTKAQMNPPLRTLDDNDALWQGIRDGIIDTVATDHAPHTLEEKGANYPASPSGVPGIETMLPLLLHAVHLGKITYGNIVRVTSLNPSRIFTIQKNNHDMVVVDPEEEWTIHDEEMMTKCRWSPFHGWKITGKPKMTILGEHSYQLF